MPLTAAVIVLTSQMRNRIPAWQVEQSCRLPSLHAPLCLALHRALALILIWDVGSSRAGCLGLGPQCTLNFRGLLNKQMQKWISRAWPLLPGFQAAVGEGLLVPSFLRAIRSAVPFLKRPPQ